ncbi:MULTISPECIES: hypothetical protein [Clavibacter]|uniref:Uncharacterized protein n=2 Tax=Clavibacter TaxID=1573 RepID=A0A399NW24_9MICO|nr:MULTISPECIES: hypothetical protein [Clavibacter]KDP89897.1 hypothetical protein W824_10255 [Clavibacter cf. michiganensis LMG 26808]RII96846.1 hypothetical protein DZF96_09755 [Clavibacter michiganensis]UKF24056.1 hypothetical protein KYT88_09970 [Clavibacter sp. A6099]
MTTPTPSPRGRVWRARRFADRHPGVPALGVAAAYAGIMIYSRAAFGHEVSVERILATLTTGALGGIVLTLVLRRRRRGGPPLLRWIDVSEAIDDGRLPADAEEDADSWRFLLLRRREVHDQLGGPWAVLVTTVVLGGTIALGALGGPPYAWTLPAVVAAMVAGMAVVRRHRVAEIDALLQPLLDQDRAPEAPAAAGASDADSGSASATGPGRRPPT